MMFHIARVQEWNEAQATGFYKPLSFQKIGLIHFCRREEIESVSNRYFKGHGDLLLLQVDPMLIGDSPSDQMINEAGELHSPLGVDAVVRIYAHEPDHSGLFKLVD